MSEILVGINSITEALKNGRQITVIHVARERTDARLEALLKLAREQGIRIMKTERAAMDRMAGGSVHQGVAAEAADYSYSTVDEILEFARSEGEDPLLLILDGLEDPHNLGAIIRTAEGLGAHGVIIPRHGACEVTAAVGRASAGASEYIRVARETNLVNTIKELKNQGLWIAGTDSQATTSCFDMEYSGPLALVIGSEGKGIRRLVKESCDYLISIPMKGKVGSLNASVSCAIVLAQIVRNRRKVMTKDG